MKTVILDVQTAEQAAQDFVHAWNSGKAQRSARISFSSPERGQVVFPYESVKVEFLLQAA